MIGRVGEPPVPPLNLVGDFGGGGLMLAFGIVCGILEAERSGVGQVIDAAMVDGAALLAGMIHGLRSVGDWGPRGTNLLDTGAWFYEVYETADGGYISLGPIDERSCQELLRLTGLSENVDGGGPVPDQSDRDSWASMKHRMSALVRTKTRAEWCALLEGTDACFAPVLSPEEAREHPHIAGRQTFVEIDGVAQPAPAPRFSRTVPEVAGPPARPGQHTDEALADWGFAASEIAVSPEAGAIR